MSLFFILGIWDILSRFANLLGNELEATFTNVYHCITLSEKRKYSCFAIILLITLGIIIICGLLLWPVSDNTGVY